MLRLANQMLATDYMASSQPIEPADFAKMPDDIEKIVIASQLEKQECPTRSMGITCSQTLKY